MRSAATDSFLSYWRTMLSVKYHITYWVVAAWAGAVYRLFAPCPFCVTAFRLIVGPLAAYITYVTLRWDCDGKRSTELTILTHQALVTCLLVALGSVTDYFQLPDESIPKPVTLIHVLSAFVTLGVLESLRQNRRDIEPATFRLVQSGPRTELDWGSWCQTPAHLASILVYNAILFGILLATDRVLRKVGGMSLRHIVPYWGWQDIQYRGRLGSAVAAHYLGGPFADVAETIYYALCRTFVPHLAGPWGWMPRLSPLLIPVFPFLSPYFEITDYALYWLPRMLLSRYQYREGASLDEPIWGLVIGLLRVYFGY
ncbi:hypothetical protein GGR55DRAFT_97428 [Xylaria sp. FL0064]|nr:hypothetical protein GGR55DRAFT_97428 [Xylaria sp. FL0064]